MIKEAIVKPGETPSAEDGTKSACIVNNEAAATGQRPKDIRDLQPPIETGITPVKDK